jgi:glycosyltransferase involved in cell wall biosynthesis
MFAGVAARLAATHGVRTFVAFPSIEGPSRRLAGSCASIVTLDGTLTSRTSVDQIADFIRRERVQVVYLTDRRPWHWVYPRLRRAGARRVIVHARTSGPRRAPQGLKRAIKWGLLRIGMTADTLVAVSDYVAELLVTVGLVPAARVVRVWNGIDDSPPASGSADSLRALLGADTQRPIIASASRAVQEKGVADLLRAFDELASSAGTPAPVLAFIGDGPYLPALRALRESLPSRDSIHLLGYRPDAAELVGSADIAVFPTWHEALGNSVMEAMVSERAVIATRVGGIPELIEDNVSGVLVGARDVPAIREAMRTLLADPGRRAALGHAARQRMVTHFSRARQVDEIVRLLAPAYES